MTWLDELTPKQIERFWSKVDHRGPDECWLWTAALNTNGYGKLALRVGGERRDLLAHRFALILRVGRSLDAGEYATHTCDTPACVNPRHLVIGSPLTNMRDKFQRNRDGNPMSFERAEELRELYRSGWKQTRLAERFGIQQPQVSRIISGKKWNPNTFAHRQSESA